MPAGFNVTSLQPAFDEVILDINNFGSWAIQNNGQELLNLWNAVNNLCIELNNQGIVVSYPASASIYANWNNFPNIQL